MGDIRLATFSIEVVELQIASRRSPVQQTMALERLRVMKVRARNPAKKPREVDPLNQVDPLNEDDEEESL